MDLSFCLVDEWKGESSPVESGFNQLEQMLPIHTRRDVQNKLLKPLKLESC